MERLTDIELTSIETTDPKPKSFAINATAILIQVSNQSTLKSSITRFLNKTGGKSQPF